MRNDWGVLGPKYARTVVLAANMKRTSVNPQKWVVFGALLVPAYMAATINFSVISGTEWPHIYPVLGRFILGAIAGGIGGAVFAVILYWLKR